MPQNTNKQSRYSKIEVDRNLCIGAASCIAVAPGVFELDNENKAVVKNPTAVDDDTILMAAKSCPVLAIKLYGKDGKQIFPE
jgi:ferredoxin